MALRKHVTLAFALLALTAMLVGCANDTVAPVGQNEAPVLAPTNVRAEIVNGGDIFISWDPSTQVTVRGYNVYRNDPANSVIARLTPSVISETSFTDGTAEFSHAYEYRVTAVSSKNTESSYTAVVITNRDPLPERRDKPVLQD